YTSARGVRTEAPERRGTVSQQARAVATVCGRAKALPKRLAGEVAHAGTSRVRDGDLRRVDKPCPAAAGPLAQFSLVSVHANAFVEEAELAEDGSSHPEVRSGAEPDSDVALLVQIHGGVDQGGDGGRIVEWHAD